MISKMMTLHVYAQYCHTC